MDYSSILGIALCLCTAGLYTYRMLTYLSYRKSITLTLSDEDPVMDEVQEESYNGRPLWITEAERPSWDAMSREMKRKIVRDVEKKIKDGKLYVHTDETGFTGLISMQEAKEKGYI